LYTQIENQKSVQHHGEKEDPKERVKLVSPYGGEDVVGLNVNGAKRQKPGHKHLGGHLPKPRRVGDLVIELALVIL
jgi:hypothetical protein